MKRALLCICPPYPMVTPPAGAAALLGYLKAQVSFGRNHPDFGDEFTAWLADEPVTATTRARRTLRTRAGVRGG